MLEKPIHLTFKHRVAFTRNVFAPGNETIADLISHCGDEPPHRVVVFIDQGLVTDDEGLISEIESYFEANRSHFELGLEPCVLPGGEQCKNEWSFVPSLWEALDEAKLDRHSFVFVIGGGAILDLVGFAAATAHRGIRLIRFPTTTLSQGDGGVGVKNGVNYFGKKNWIGTFAVPWAVINDSKLLETLSDRDFRCGFSEAVKVALLKSEPFFRQLCDNATAIADRESIASFDAIHQSARHHLNHIANGGDPFEHLEARPLDFGHWAAHRLEVLSNFELRHGEAVAIGVAIDSIYSSKMFGFPDHDVEQIVACLRDMGIRMHHPQLERIEALFDGLDEFRQHLGGQLTLTMLEAVGRPIEVHEIDLDAMTSAIRRVSDYVGVGV